MHQPIYYPYESPIEVDANNRFSFSVVDVHNQRLGPYIDWPRDAVQAASGLWHAGAQVSFTGSLIENLEQPRGRRRLGLGTNWDWAYDESRQLDHANSATGAWISSRSAITTR